MISFVLLALAATAVTAQSGASRVRSNVVSARSGSGDTFVCPQKSRFNEDLVLVTYSGDPADTFYAQCNYGTNIGSGSSTATSFVRPSSWLD